VNVQQRLLRTFNEIKTYLQNKSKISREKHSLSHFYEILSYELSGYLNSFLVKIWVVSPKSEPNNDHTAAQSSNIYEKLAGLTDSEVLLL
jgi:hypothetical protein